jgi:hypothetical protein
MLLDNTRVLLTVDESGQAYWSAPGRRSIGSSGRIFDGLSASGFHPAAGLSGRSAPPTRSLHSLYAILRRGSVVSRLPHPILVPIILENRKKGKR